jgi:hypothetical protein
MLEPMNHTTLEEDRNSNHLDIKDLIEQLADVDPSTQNAAFAAIQSNQDSHLWHNLLTLMATGTLNGTRVPDLYPASSERDRLAIKIYSLYVHDPVPVTAPVKRETLLRGLHDTQPAVRQVAAKLLGARHCSQATEALIATLADDTSEVQRAAVNALEKIGDPAAVGPLVRALQSDDGLVRESAREALIVFGDLAVAALTELLTDPDDRLRWEATKALSEIGDPAAAPALVRRLEDENGGIRWLAAEALINVGRPALRPLYQALTEHSESAWLRGGAHHVLRVLAKEDRLHDVVMPVLDALSGIELDIEVIEAAHAALNELEEPHWQTGR